MRDKTEYIHFLNVTFKVKKNPTYTGNHFMARVSRVMGNTYPTEFSEHMRPEFLGGALEAWKAQGIPGGIMDVDDGATALCSSFSVALNHPEIDSSELKFDARPE